MQSYDALGKAENQMKKRQRKVRLIRAASTAGIFYLWHPALFSTAFAGVKSIFQAIAAHQPVTWNSFLDVTGALLLVTILFGRHFCGYACAFGSLGDAMYEADCFLSDSKVFHKKGKTWLSGKSSQNSAEGEICASGISSAFHS